MKWQARVCCMPRCLCSTACCRLAPVPAQEEIQYELDRRRPGQSRITTPRNESDTCELLSGMAPDGATTLGTPICVLVRNKDQKSKDYSEMEQAYRPSHAGATPGWWGGARFVSAAVAQATDPPFRAPRCNLRLQVRHPRCGRRRALLSA